MKVKRFTQMILVLSLVLLTFCPILPAAAQTALPPPAATATPAVTPVPTDEAPLLPPVSDLGSFLKWIIGPGLTIAVGWFMSFLADKFDFWQKVPHDIKVILPYIVAIAMVLLGQFLLSRLPSILQDKTLSAIVSSLLFYWSTQKQHDHYDAQVAAVAK